jgi:AcrR family transcriptional regulator
MFLKIINLESKRRDAVLNAALKEFATKGFDEASTNEIAKEAGISKGLMFHYVNSKKDLFLFLYDYCTDMINKEYFDLMNFKENDIFERLRQSYLLQLELMQKHPWIFDFNKVSAITKSDEINKELEERLKGKQSLCYEVMFDSIDKLKFREGLDIEKCKQLIFWANIGFTNQMLEDIRNAEINELDYDRITAKLDGYLNELRKIFYKQKINKEPI